VLSLDLADKAVAITIYINNVKIYLKIKKPGGEMAIFGDLKQISLADLLPLLKNQKGSLEIFNLNNLPHITMYVESGKVTSILLAGKPIDEIQIHSVIDALINAERGSFEFIPGASPKKRRSRDWDLDTLVLSVTTIADEIIMAKNNMPHPDTIFIIASNTNLNDKRLLEFWKRAKKYFTRGASARQLSQELGVPLNHAGYYVLRLRQAGLIKPARTIANSIHRRGLAGRLLGALKRRFLGA